MKQNLLITGFGARIATLANDRGLTARKLAQKAGITPSRIYTYINEESIPSAEAIAKISSILETSVDYILFGENNSQKVKASTDPDLEAAVDLLTDLYQNSGSNLRGWAIITFENAFEEYFENDICQQEQVLKRKKDA